MELQHQQAEHPQNEARGESGARQAEYLSLEYQEALSGNRQDRVIEGLVKKARKKVMHNQLKLG